MKKVELNFESAEERDLFLKQTFPTREMLDTPGWYSIGGANELNVHDLTVYVYFNATS